jgi:hypothetical protein
MTLLESLLSLVKEAESRRLEMRELFAAVGHVAETIGSELRDGDRVDLDGRVVSAVSFQVPGARGGTKRLKTLAIDDRPLGERTASDPGPRASLADNRWFAQHAQDIFAAFSRQLARDKRRLKSDRQLVEDPDDEPGA